VAGVVACGAEVQAARVMAASTLAAVKLVRFSMGVLRIKMDNAPLGAYANPKYLGGVGALV
jgi:hypothetical protein